MSTVKVSLPDFPVPVYVDKATVAEGCRITMRCNFRGQNLAMEATVPAGTENESNTMAAMAAEMHAALVAIPEEKKDEL